MDNQRTNRNILPKPPRSDLPPLAQTKYKHKREVVPVACDRCRARKIKCNGEKPACHACIRVGHACNYQEPRHREKKPKTPKTTSKKAPARDAPRAPTRTIEWDANAIFERLEAGKRFGENGAPSASDPGLGQEGFNTAVPDTTQGSLPISTWISVTADDALTTHLLSLFWAFDTSVARIVQQDKFIESLCVGRPSTTTAEPAVRGQVEFCSELLVHSILAMATIHWSSSDGLDHVLALGKSCAQYSTYMLKNSVLAPTLTMFQSAVALWVYELANNNLEASESMFELSLQLYDDLQEVWNHQHVLAGNDPASQSNFQVVSASVWGFYLLSLKSSLHSERFRNIPRPKLSPGTEFETPDLASNVRLWLQSREFQMPPSTGLVSQTVQLASLVLETLLQAEVDSMIPFPDSAKAQNLYNRIWATKHGITQAMMFHPAKPPLLIDTCIIIDLMALKLLKSFSRFRVTEFACKQTAHALELQHGISITTTLWDYRVQTGSHLDMFLLQSGYAAVMTLLPQLPHMLNVVDACTKTCRMLHERRQNMPIVERMLGQLGSVLATKGDGNIPTELRSLIPLAQDGARVQFATGSGVMDGTMRNSGQFDSFFPMQ